MIPLLITLAAGVGVFTAVVWFAEQALRIYDGWRYVDTK